MKPLPHVDKARYSALAIMVVAVFPAFASLPRHRFLNGDTRYTFDAADRLVSAQVAQGSNTYAETYLYDLNGALTNIVSDGESVFDAAYNALGQLTSLNLRESVPSVDYSYDPLGNRIVSGDRIWIPDHADSLKRPLMECDLSGNVLRYYIWAPGRLLGFIDAASGALTVAHCDEYSSVIALTDASGNVLHEACYGPYGEDWGSAGANPTPFAWLGGYGVFNVGGGSLYLTRHRLYNASLCRFLSADPLGLDGGPNLYAYCMGNPLAYIDPQGLAISAAYSSAHDFLPSLFTQPIDTVLSLYSNYRYYGGGIEGGLMAVNAAVNPAVSALTYGYEALTGLGMQSYNSGQTLSVTERIGSGVIATASAAATAAAGFAGAGAMSSAAGSTTALSPYRYTTAGETFQHYSSLQHAESLAGGLRPGSYSTTARGLSGVEAQRGLALPQVNPPNAVYTISPPAGTPIRVNPITRPQFRQPGGLPEIEFILGTPPGSVSGPTLIPRGIP